MLLALAVTSAVWNTVIVILGVAVLLGTVAVIGLVWAERHHQFDNVERGAVSIFDDEEPVGRVTDQVLRPAVRTKGGAP